MSSSDSDVPHPLRAPRVCPLIMGGPTKIFENMLLVLRNNLDIPDEFYFRILGIHDHVDDPPTGYFAFFRLISRLYLHDS